jgi:hypothetical protein
MVLAVMLSSLDSGRFVVWDKHIDVPTEQVGSNRTVEGGRYLRGYSDDSPHVEMRTKAKEKGPQCRAEKRAGNGNRSVRVEDDSWVGSEN